MRIGEGSGITAGAAGLGYLAYKNRGAIQRGMRRMTRGRVRVEPPVDEEMGLLSDTRDFFLEQHNQRAVREGRIRQRPRPQTRQLNKWERGTQISDARRAEMQPQQQPRQLQEQPRPRPRPRPKPRGTDIEMQTLVDRSVPETEGQFMGESGALGETEATEETPLLSRRRTRRSTNVRRRRLTEQGSAEERTPLLEENPMLEKPVPRTTDIQGVELQTAKQKPINTPKQQMKPQVRQRKVVQNKPGTYEAAEERIPTLEELAGKRSGVNYRTDIKPRMDVEGGITQKMKMGGQVEYVEDGNPFNLPFEDRPTISEVGQPKTSLIGQMTEKKAKLPSDIPEPEVYEPPEPTVPEEPTEPVEPTVPEEPVEPVDTIPRPFEPPDVDVDAPYNPFLDDPALRTPISETGQGGTSIIGDMMGGTEPLLPEDIPPSMANTLLEGVIIDGTETAEVATGLAAATTFSEIGAILVPELIIGLAVGGALYGIEKGVEVVFDIGREQDKKYFDKRNREEGSHEMDDRETYYKLLELREAQKYYQDQVEHHNFGKDEATVKKHEQDKAMLASITKSLEAVRDSRQNGVPVYSVVSNGFDKEQLSKEDRKEFDRLEKRLKKQQEEVNYHGGDKERLANRQRKYDAFVDEHSNAPVSIAITGKATDEELERITKQYVETGGDLFEGVDPEMLKVLGIADAIADEEVQTQRRDIEEDEKVNTDEIAEAQGLVTQLNDGIGSTQ